MEPKVAWMADGYKPKPTKVAFVGLTSTRIYDNTDPVLMTSTAREPITVPSGAEPKTHVPHRSTELDMVAFAKRALLASVSMNTGTWGRTNTRVQSAKQRARYRHNVSLTGFQENTDKSKKPSIGDELKDTMIITSSRRPNTAREKTLDSFDTMAKDIDADTESRKYDQQSLSLTTNFFTKPTSKRPTSALPQFASKTRQNFMEFYRKYPGEAEAAILNHSHQASRFINASGFVQTEQEYLCPKPPSAAPAQAFMDRHASCHNYTHVHKHLLLSRPRKACETMGSACRSMSNTNNESTNDNSEIDVHTNLELQYMMAMRPFNVPFIMRPEHRPYPKGNSVVIRGTKPHFCNFVSKSQLHHRYGIPDEDFERLGLDGNDSQNLLGYGDDMQNASCQANLDGSYGDLKGGPYGSLDGDLNSGGLQNGAYGGYLEGGTYGNIEGGTNSDLEGATSGDLGAGSSGRLRDGSYGSLDGEDMDEETRRRLGYGGKDGSDMAATTIGVEIISKRTGKTATPGEDNKDSDNTRGFSEQAKDLNALSGKDGRGNIGYVNALHKAPTSPSSAASCKGKEKRRKSITGKSKRLTSLTRTALDSAAEEAARHALSVSSQDFNKQTLLVDEAGAGGPDGQDSGAGGQAEEDDKNQFNSADEGLRRSKLALEISKLSQERIKGSKGLPPRSSNKKKDKSYSKYDRRRSSAGSNDSEALLNFPSDLTFASIESKTNPSGKRGKAMSGAESELRALSAEIENPKYRPWEDGRLALSQQACRFELPMDMRVLENIAPQEYLRKFCVFSARRGALYQKVFMKYKDRTGHIAIKDLNRALSDVLLNSITPDQVKEVCELVDLNNSSKIDLKLFGGLAAYCERILYPLHVTMGTSELEDYQRHGVETADFCSLKWKFRGLSVNPQMQKILEALVTK